jgi:hypothetical protein
MSSNIAHPSRVSQVQQSNLMRSSSSDRVVHQVLSSSLPRVEMAMTPPKEEPFMFASFLDNTHSEGPVLSFTTGIDASHDVEEQEEKEEVEWAWGAPSADPLPPVFETDTEPERGAEMLVDLNSAFSAAFGEKFETPVPKRKGHSRGLSGVFVSPPAIVLPAASAAEAPVAIDDGTPKSRRRDSVSPRHLLAHKAAAAEKSDVSGLLQREKVVRELLASEQVYVDNLHKLIDLFYRPLTGRNDESMSRGS